MSGNDHNTNHRGISASRRMIARHIRMHPKTSGRDHRFLDAVDTASRRQAMRRKGSALLACTVAAVIAITACMAMIRSTHQRSVGEQSARTAIDADATANILLAEARTGFVRTATTDPPLPDAFASAIVVPQSVATLTFHWVKLAPDATEWFIGQESGTGQRYHHDGRPSGPLRAGAPPLAVPPPLP